MTNNNIIKVSINIPADIFKAIQLNAQATNQDIEDVINIFLAKQTNKRKELLKLLNLGKWES
ncbi:hypothetical protein AAEX28_04235 [Lentisphaerota bacterium WC36G]|nr:hypothetical protein LJT99_07105 [Lentisphaerae bacterium WC36]